MTLKPLIYKVCHSICVINDMRPSLQCVGLKIILYSLAYVHLTVTLSAFSVCDTVGNASTLIIESALVHSHLHFLCHDYDDDDKKEKSRMGEKYN